MPRYLTPAELAALIRYASAPPATIPSPHPLAAERFLTHLDREAAAHVDRILAMVDPYIERRPIRLTKAGFQRLAAMYYPPSRTCSWYAWQSDMNQIERRAVAAGCPIPRDWYRCRVAGPAEYTPEFWHGQWVPHPRGRHNGHTVAWRSILPFPSTAATALITLDNLAEEVEANRPARRRSPSAHRPLSDEAQGAE